MNAVNTRPIYNGSKKNKSFNSPTSHLSRVNMPKEIEEIKESLKSQKNIDSKVYSYFGGLIRTMGPSTVLCGVNTNFLPDMVGGLILINNNEIRIKNVLNKLKLVLDTQNDILDTSEYIIYYCK